MKKNKIIAVILAVATITSNIALPVSAVSKESAEKKIEFNNKKIDDLKNQKEEVNKQKSEEESKLSELQKKLNDKSLELKKSLDKVSEYENKIKTLEDEIKDLDDKTKNLEEEINNKEKNIQTKEEEQKKSMEMLGLRLRNMYKTDIEKEMLAILISSKDFGDLITKIANLSKIISMDKKLINDTEKIKEELLNQKDELKAKKIEIQKEKKNIENNKIDIKKAQDEVKKERDTYKSQYDELDSLENQKKDLINSFTDKEKELNDKIGDLSSFNEEVKKEIDNMFNSTNSNNATNSSNGSGSASGGQASSAKGFIKPSGGGVTCPFGPRIHPVTGKQGFHTGVDLGAGYGSDIVAAKDGTVVTATYNSAYGNMIIVNHGGGVQTMYAHSSKLLVSPGQTVKQGQVIAKVGSTGLSTGAHLHFEVRINGQSVNPMNYI